MVGVDLQPGLEESKCRAIVILGLGNDRRTLVIGGVPGIQPNRVLDGLAGQHPVIIAPDATKRDHAQPVMPVAVFRISFNDLPDRQQRFVPAMLAHQGDSQAFPGDRVGRIQIQRGPGGGLGFRPLLEIQMA